MRQPLILNLRQSVAVFVALLIVGVQQLVSQMAAGLVEILGVECLDFGVVVALAQCLGSVLLIEGLGALCTDVGAHLDL